MKNRILLSIISVVFFVVSCSKRNDYIHSSTEQVKKIKELIAAPLYSLAKFYTPLPEFEPGKLLIQFVSNGNQKAVPSDMLKSAKLILTPQMKTAGHTGIWKINVPRGTERSELARLRVNPDIKKVELNQSRQALGVIPNDPYYNPEQMWSLFRINVQAAWNSGNYGRPNEVTQIIDEPFNPCHPDFNNRVVKNPGEIDLNGIDDDNNGKIDDVWGWNFVLDAPMVFQGPVLRHGQHVAGTILARADNNNQIAGIARNGKVLATPFLGVGGGWTDAAIDAIYYGGMMKAKYPATHNVGRSNNSWGGGSPNAFLDEAIRIVGEQNDIGFVCAAGNGNNNNDVNPGPSYPASYAPANPYVLPVVASSWDDARAGFSSYSQKAAIAAPGVSVLSLHSNGGVTELSGTSMASPHIAAADHLMRSVHPDWNFLKRKDSMFFYARIVDTLKPYTKNGGIVDLSAKIYLGVTDHTDPTVVCDYPYPSDDVAPSAPQNLRPYGNPAYGISPDGSGFFGLQCDPPIASEGVVGTVVFLDGPAWQWGVNLPSMLTGVPVRDYFPYAKFYDAWGNSSVSSNVTSIPLLGVTPPPPDTEAPTLNGNPALTNITTSSIKVSYPAATDNKAITGYNINYRQQGGLWNTISTALTTHDFTSLASNTTYEFNYNAKDAAGNVSGNSATVSGTTLIVTPPPPPPPAYNVSVSVSAQQTGFNPLTATLNWTTQTNGNISSIRVERRKGSGSYQIIGSPAVTATSFVDNSIPNPGQYFWRVTVTISQGQTGSGETNQLQVKKK